MLGLFAAGAAIGGTLGMLLFGDVGAVVGGGFAIALVFAVWNVTDHEPWA